MSDLEDRNTPNLPLRYKQCIEGLYCARGPIERGWWVGEPVC